MNHVCNRNSIQTILIILSKLRARHKGNSKPRHFANDNYAGICPTAFAALAQWLNTGHEVSYGDDAWTTKTSDLIRDVFETKCEVFLVFNGTSANSLFLASLSQPYHSVHCREIAHLEVSECGAPEFFASGTKILLLPGESGKIEAAAIDGAVIRRTDIHKPRALTLTQATEVGTVYTPEELKALCGVARKFGLRVHMDGARLIGPLHFRLYIGLMSTLHMDREVVAVRSCVRPASSPSAHAHGLDHH